MLVMQEAVSGLFFFTIPYLFVMMILIVQGSGTTTHQRSQAQETRTAASVLPALSGLARSGAEPDGFTRPCSGCWGALTKQENLCIEHTLAI
jgi:hypothetical protein